MSRRTSSDTPSPSQSDISIGNGARTPSIANGYAGGKARSEEQRVKEDKRAAITSTTTMDDLDVQSIINERRPSKLKIHGATTSTGDQYSAAIRGDSYGHIYIVDDRSDEMSPCGGNASESGTGSVSAAGSVSNGSGSRSGGSGTAVVHIGEGGVIGSVVRIYVDDTDSASSNGHLRGKLHDDEALDASTTVSSSTTVRGVDGNGDGDGGDGDRNETDEGTKTPERPSSGGPLDPS